MAEELKKRQQMKQELQKLTSIANEKSAMLYHKKASMEELPKVIQDIEGSIRKAYSLLFNEKVMSKQEIVAMSEAPSKMQVSLNKFQSSSLSTTKYSGISSVAVCEVEDDYRPKQAGLVFSHAYTVDVDIERIIGASLDRIYALVDNENIQKVPLSFQLTVGYFHTRLCTLTSLTY